MTPQEIEAALAAPFNADEIKFKPGKVSGNRAMALGYVDARVVQDRLDDVIGSMNWQDEYERLPNGTVLCKLRIKIADEWITKSDVGSESEQPDEGDRTKAAFSDALKRAAVKFGVGRFLYRLPAQWCDFDPQKRQFVKKPELAEAAKPAPRPASWAKDIETGLAVIGVAVPKGYAALKMAWDSLSHNQRAALKPFIELFKELSRSFDALIKEVADAAGRTNPTE